MQKLLDKASLRTKLSDVDPDHEPVSTRHNSAPSRRWGQMVTGQVSTRFDKHFQREELQELGLETCCGQYQLWSHMEFEKTSQGTFL